MKDAAFIYSQWEGYLKCSNDEYYGAEEMSAFRNDPMVNWVYAHTSGHAIVEDLQAFAKALDPKMLVPVHTEQAQQFGKHFSNVVLLKDNKPIEI